MDRRTERQQQGGTQERETRALGAEEEASLQSSVRMGEVSQQEPGARLSDSLAGGREGGGEQAVSHANNPFDVNSLPR